MPSDRERALKEAQRIRDLWYSRTPADGNLIEHIADGLLESEASGLDWAVMATRDNPGIGSWDFEDRAKELREQKGDR